MFSILISEKGGETKRMEFDRPEITIGRVAGNDIVLPRNNISKRHSRIVFKDGKFIVVDLKSTNGTFVNGRKITGPQVIKGTDKLYVGDYIMSIEEGTGPSTSSTADIDAAAKAPPPPPPRIGAKATLAAMPVIRAEATSMDVSAGLEDDDSEDEIDDAVMADAPPKSAPPAPPVLPSLPVPALRTTGKPFEALKSALAEAASMDRPVVAADRISDKATMMATDAPKIPSPPVAAPAPAFAASHAPSSPPSSGPPLSAPAPFSTPIATASPTMSTPPPSPVPAVLVPSSGPTASTIAGSAVPAKLMAPRPMTSPLPAPKPVPKSGPAPASRPAPISAGPPVDDPQRRRYHEIFTQAVTKVLEQLGMSEASSERLAEATIKIDKAAREVADKIFPLPLGLESDVLAKHVVAELTAIGPVDELLADETIQEIAIAAPDRIYVDRGTGPSLHDRMFSTNPALQRVIQRLVGRAGTKFTAGLVEVRLDSGTVLLAGLPPQARTPTLLIRKIRKSGGRLQDLVSQGVLSAAMSEFLEVCMRERRNLVVSGYGRGVMLGALGGATAAGARVVTVEPVSEIDLSGTSAAWIGLIGRGQETRSLIAHAVRMHPDHLLLSDVRGPEALDVTAAFCGGQGVVAAVEAASAREAIGRLESLARLTIESPSRKALREELAQSVNLAVHVGRTAAGAYRVMEISEVTLGEEGGIELVPVFTFKPEGGDGQFVATGHVPEFAS